MIFVNTNRYKLLLIGDIVKKKRTGLIIESNEFAEFNGTNGINSKIEEYESCTVTTVNVDNDHSAKLLGREKGKYITIETDNIYRITDSDFDEIVNHTADSIRKMIKISDSGRVLIAGIGNREITPDSLGPKCIDRIIVTRGLENTQPQLLGKTGFSSVCAICANVFGVTGIESAEITEGIAKILKPELIIIIDALATVSLSRLCKTVQISNTSLTPGGGVDNSREEISSQKLNTPIISIGMPTVIDVKSILQNAKIEESSIPDILEDYEDSLIAVPANIDTATDTAAKLIAFSINKALHHDMSTEDILKFLY